MLSGYPFRMVQQTQQSLNSFISLLGSLYQLPHPQVPDMPLASDPNLDVTGFLYRSIEFLRKELSYSGKYKPTDSSSDPTKLSDADKRRAATGRPVRDELTPSLPGLQSGANARNNGGGTIPGTNLPASGGAAGFGGQSVAGGIPGAQRKFEYKQPLPGPGSILGLPSDPNQPGTQSGQLGFSGQFGSPDFQSPSFNPGLLGGGNGLLGGQRVQPGSQPNPRRVSKSSKRRKS